MNVTTKLKQEAGRRFFPRLVAEYGLRGAVRILRRLTEIEELQRRRPTNRHAVVARSAPTKAGSEKVRFGRAQAVDRHRQSVARVHAAAFWFGMGSVGQRGSVGAPENSCWSSAWPRRAGHSVVLK